LEALDQLAVGGAVTRLRPLDQDLDLVHGHGITPLDPCVWSHRPREAPPHGDRPWGSRAAGTATGCEPVRGWQRGSPVDGERRGPETEAHPRFVRGKVVLLVGPVVGSVTPGGSGES